MCCGQKREALRNSGAPETAGGSNAGAKPAEGYYLRNVPVRLRAALTGRPTDVAKQPPRPAR